MCFAVCFQGFGGFHKEKGPFLGGFTIKEKGKVLLLAEPPNPWKIRQKCTKKKQGNLQKKKQGKPKKQGLEGQVDFVSLTF